MESIIDDSSDDDDIDDDDADNSISGSFDKEKVTSEITDCMVRLIKVSVMVLVNGFVW